MQNLRFQNETGLNCKMGLFNFIEQRVYDRSYYGTLLLLFLIASEIASDCYQKFKPVTACMSLASQ